MTPNAIGSKHPAWRRQILRQYAEVVRDVAKKEGARLVDVHFMFRVRGKPDHLLLDGMHPNEKGHEMIADLLIKTLTWMRPRSSSPRATAGGRRTTRSRPWI